MPAEIRTQNGFLKGIFTFPIESVLHFFRSILAKSALDILGASVGVEEGPGGVWSVPFSVLGPVMVGRCNARGKSESWVLPFPRLERETSLCAD